MAVFSSGGLTIISNMDIGRILILLLFSSSVALLVFAGLMLLKGANNPVHRRLQELAIANNTEPNHSLNLKQKLVPLVNLILPKNDNDRRHAQARLIQAGFYSDTAVWFFYSFKLALSLLLPLLVILLAIITAFNPTTRVLLIAIALAAFTGMILPDWGLKKAIEKRHRLIAHAIPDALDLLILCLEAGLGLRSAIQRSSRDLFLSHPEFAQELDMVGSELKAGLAPNQAMENLGTRVNMKELDGLVSTIVDSIRFGTTIADTLRAFAADLRDKRVQTAEEHAEKIRTKLIFPIALLLIPALFIIVLAPAVLGLVESFAQY